MNWQRHTVRSTISFMAVTGYLDRLSEKFGATGAPMYDPSAVAVAIDPTLVKTQAMHVDVETRGEFTRGETVGNRHGYVERNVLHGDHMWIEDVDKVAPNAKVCVDVDADRFCSFLSAEFAASRSRWFRNTSFPRIKPESSRRKNVYTA